ncbi:MAG: hypothetical protein M8357_10345 [Desulfobulbaceae bacterium]|nr:hypothetical protein [Desulfobulbaceae bacterium]
MGGLSRRAYILNKIQQEEPGAKLVLDAGAMLFAQPVLAPSLVTARTVQAGGIIEAMAEMGYDAFGLAPQDLVAGIPFLLQQPEDLQLPWLSMNLVQPDSEQPLFAPYIIKNAGDLSIGILGLTGRSQDVSGQQDHSGHRFLPWEKTLGDTLARIRDQTDMVILLSSLPEQTNREIAQRFDDIHLLIQSGQSAAHKTPQLFGNTLITQIGSRGKHIGRLDIDWKPSRTWKQSAQSGIKPIKDRLDRINWQIGRLIKRYGSDPGEQNAQYQQLLEEKNRLTAELAEIEARRQGEEEQLATYRSSYISLPVSLPEDQEVREIIHRTKLAVNKINRSTLGDLQQRRSQVNQQAFSNLAGWQVCQSCHKPQTEFWQQTAHAKAWQTLVRENQQFNPECLICHVTLPTYDQDSVIDQNLLAGLKEEYKTIGCEACHGPARDHSLQPDRFRPAQPDEQTCLMCHTPERDDNFIYSEKLNKIRCPAAGH